VIEITFGNGIARKKVTPENAELRPVVTPAGVLWRIRPDGAL
jgi:hypothetical protein